MIKLGKVSEQTRDAKTVFPTEVTGFPELEI
jgi:hypothetical protein